MSYKARALTRELHEIAVANEFAKSCSHAQLQIEFTYHPVHEVTRPEPDAHSQTCTCIRNFRQHVADGARSQSAKPSLGL